MEVDVDVGLGNLIGCVVLHGYTMGRVVGEFVLNY